MAQHASGSQAHHVLLPEDETGTDITGGPLQLLLDDQRRNGQDYVRPELAGPPDQGACRLPLVRDPPQRVVLRERLPEVDGCELEVRGVGLRSLEPAFAGDERGAVEVEDVVATSGQRASQLRWKRVAEVVAENDPHVSARQSPPEPAPAP